MTEWVARLDPFGIDPRGLHALDADSPDLLPYATLTHARRDSASVLGTVGAVYEWQDAPLIFLVDADRITAGNDIHRLRRLLAMRGDAPYLGVVAPGRIDIYTIALDRKTPAQARVGFAGEASKDLFPQLANRRPRAARTRSGWISNVVLRLLTEAIDRLIELRVGHGDAISLVGRALFARFLADRDLLPDSLASADTVSALFDNAANARAASTWLDETFNGDLLPLSATIFEHLSNAAYHVLGNIMVRAPGGQLFFDWQERWDRLNFAHIPVGVLSQAYELYLRKHAAEKQRKEGGFYMPRPIADLLVRASFRALERDRSSANARILDPAAGAGVFLLTAFRELVAARWRVDGKRPDTQCLRRILTDQITGFDVNEEALRFAALALYLVSIELDPEPRPVEKLGFDDLRGKVLHRVSGEHETPGGELGSLGPLVGDEHRGRYDIVVGNPPWSTGTKLADWSLVLKAVAKIASERAGEPLAPPIPNESLDLPFIWRAMDWARPGGQIAFALHARLLFQQGDGMPEARRRLFQALDITSIINGVELRKTKVWPEISAPFCLLIANNRVPEPGAGFRLISPRFEAGLNASGTMRIDAGSAELIATQQMLGTPELLKILFRGTKADLGLVERIRDKRFPTLESFWREAIGVSDRGRMAGSGQGYQQLRLSSNAGGKGNGPPGKDARHLRGLPNVTVASLDDLVIDANRLPPFLHDRVHRLRDARLFGAPVVIVHKSPPVDRGRIGVGVSDRPVVYNESFYGYCARDFPAAERLTRYLALVLGSKFTLWFALITSGEFGFERDVIEKIALDRMPLPDFRDLDDDDHAEILRLFAKVYKSAAAWSEVDRWVAKCYGLGAADLQIISDTLTYHLPFADSSARAQARPGPKMSRSFCVQLEKISRLGRSVSTARSAFGQSRIAPRRRGWEWWCRPEPPDRRRRCKRTGTRCLRSPTPRRHPRSSWRTRPVHCSSDALPKSDIGASAKPIFALVKAVKEAYGRVDIGVNATGWGLLEPFEETSADTLSRIVDVQFKGPYYLLQAFVGAMKANDPPGGSIITISSATAKIMLNDHASYMGCKAGIDHIIRVVANEFGQFGIRANSISPGLTETPMTAEATAVPGLIDAFLPGYPLGRIGTREDVAAAAAFLASDECFMTGENLQINGGLTLRRNPTREEIAEAITNAAAN